MIPPKILNRLRLGRSVASQVPPRRTGYRAWIHVRPVLRAGARVVQRDRDVEPRLTDESPNSIRGYDVRRIELHPRYLEHGYDLDYAWQDEFTQDEHLTVPDEVALERVLSRWLRDLTQLHVPSEVGYPSLPRRPQWG